MENIRYEVWLQNQINSLHSITNSIKGHSFVWVIFVD